VTARLTDELTGFGASPNGNVPWLRFQHEGGGQYVDAMFYPSDRISGTATDGIYPEDPSSPSRCRGRFGRSASSGSTTWSRRRDTSTTWWISSR
jgi:hypothetical protein